MLAKQVWRLLENKSSLFHRFFKAKFFPNGTILDAKEGNGSFSWESILKGREVIKKDIQWRVGSGALIRIYHDNWLPDLFNKCVVSPRSFLGIDARVSVLIDKDNRCWMKETIDNLFLPHEAELILSIPISLSSCEDQMVWPHNPDGLYFVRSGYRRLMEDDRLEVPSTSDLSTTRSLWKGVWGLCVPNRVKTLLWRAGTNSLSSLEKLKKRKIVLDDLCPGCKLNAKSTLHAIWSCPAIASVWSSNFGWLQEKTNSCLSFLDVIQGC